MARDGGRNGPRSRGGGNRGRQVRRGGVRLRRLDCVIFQAGVPGMSLESVLVRHRRGNIRVVVTFVLGDLFILVFTGRRGLTRLEVCGRLSAERARRRRRRWPVLCGRWRRGRAWDRRR
jgi:hypothetical protein